MAGSSTTSTATINEVGKNLRAPKKNDAISCTT